MLVRIKMEYAKDNKKYELLELTIDKPYINYVIKELETQSIFSKTEYESYELYEFLKKHYPEYFI